MDVLFICLLVICALGMFIYVSSGESIQDESEELVVINVKSQDHRFFSEKGIEILKILEGFSGLPYKDRNGYITIGYGHKIKLGELFADIDEERADILLREDILPIEDFINDHVSGEVNQNQFDALVIFIFNIGQDAFLKSRVYQNINDENYEDAIKQWATWIHVSERVKNKYTGKYCKKMVPVQGLIYRRATEIELFNA